MSDMLVVQFGALQQASGNIQTALNTMESQLSQLESDAAPLVASWSGEAREAYEERQRRWRAAAADLAAILRDIKMAVDDSSADYLATEQRNRALFD
ncbi:WXG100 family type VII secretion target [Pilimelia columellifera]|uniref:ESAT-6-like protein n=1 Tax=Pilimelia columellifera subsp. columellifera TaxID=706583 RepID=A0ABP6A453_9ACTN